MRRADAHAMTGNAATSRLAPRKAGAAVLAVALLGLAACVPTEFDRSQRPVNAYAVDQVRMTRDLAYLPGQTALDPTAEAQLAAFIAQVAPQREDRVTVVGYGPLGGERARGTALALHARGVAPVHTVMADAHRDAVTVSIVRTLYEATACQQTTPIREAAGGSFLPTPGCATAGNLARMIAEPSDLLRGRETTAVEAGRAAAAVERYRAGAVFEPRQETTSE